MQWCEAVVLFCEQGWAEAVCRNLFYDSPFDDCGVLRSLKAKNRPSGGFFMPAIYIAICD